MSKSSKAQSSKSSVQLTCILSDRVLFITTKCHTIAGTRGIWGVQIAVCSMANIVCLQQRNLERELDPSILSPRDFRNHCDSPEHPDLLGFIWKSEVECRDELDQGSLHLNQCGSGSPSAFPLRTWGRYSIDASSRGSCPSRRESG